jgi:hypothetical protein
MAGIRIVDAKVAKEEQERTQRKAKYGYMAGGTGLKKYFLTCNDWRLGALFRIRPQIEVIVFPFCFPLRPLRLCVEV